MEVLLKHREVEAEPVLHLPAPLQAVLCKMMAKKVEDRYQTPAEVAAVLAAGGEKAPVASGGREPPEASVSPDDWRRITDPNATKTFDPEAAPVGQAASLPQPPGLLEAIPNFLAKLPRWSKLAACSTALAV